jgi:hypothetical protein
MQFPAYALNQIQSMLQTEHVYLNSIYTLIPKLKINKRIDIIHLNSYEEIGKTNTHV